MESSVQLKSIVANGRHTISRFQQLGFMLSFVLGSRICYTLPRIAGRFLWLPSLVGFHLFGFSTGMYPKAQVLNRFIAKLIDLFIVASAASLIDPVGFLAGLAYILVGDGFAGGRSIGKRLIGLQTILPDTRVTAGFRESIIRNIPFAVAQMAFMVPYVGWILSAVIIAFEAVLIIGNEQGRRIGDELAGTQVLDVGRFALPD
jgi:hypothetical protein